MRSLSLPADLPSWDRPLGRLSGGERVKLQLARLLGEQPDLLLLDEPSNDLDLETLQFLEDFLRTWPGTVLFVSHDETLIRNTANVIVHLEALRRKTAPRATVARLPYDQYVRGPPGQIPAPGPGLPQRACGIPEADGPVPPHPESGGAPAGHHQPRRPPWRIPSEKEDAHPASHGPPV
ncbi:MAG: ATP-binding cassette domain-containing protein [Oscillospiraceae bacterium]